MKQIVMSLAASARARASASPIELKIVSSNLQKTKNCGFFYAPCSFREFERGT
jgi:hypothetical protein